MKESIKKREQIVRQAVANQRLEGLQVSKASLKIANDYIKGKISAKQAAQKIRSHYGVW